MFRLFVLFALCFLPALRVFAQPLNANAGPNKTFCSGSSVTLGANPAASGGTGNYTYTWTPATGLSCTTCPNPVCTATSNTTYTLTVDDGISSNSDNVNVTVTQGANASFTFSPNNQCSNTAVVFANTSTPVGAGVSYNWDFGDPASGSANTSSQMNPTHTFTAVGAATQSFTVTLTVTSATGCTNSTSQIVTVQQSPEAALLDPLTNFRNCDGSVFNLQVFDNTVPADNNAYSIDWGDGTPPFTAGAGVFPGGSTTHTYNAMGIYTITYTVTGTNGCTDVFTQLVSNITNPAIGVANPGNTNGCGPLTLCFPLSNFAGNHTSTTYRVNYGDGSPEDVFPHPPPATICHTYTESSCGSAGAAFTFSITARNSCDSSTATVTPIRVYTTPQAGFVEAPNPGCVNTPITFTNTSVPGFNASCSQSTIHTWSWGDGSANTTVLNNTPQIHTYTAPGNYVVTLSNQNGCGTTQMTRTICIEAPPVPSFTLSPASGCVPLSTSISNTSDTLLSCAVNYNWVVTFNGSVCTPATGAFQYTGGTNANSWEPQIQFTAPGNYTVQLQMSNSCGTYTASETLVVHKAPEIDFLPLATICEGQSVTPAATFTDCSSPITAVSWTFPGGSPAVSASQTPGTVSFATAGNPTLTVSATNSCGTVNASQTLTVSAAPPAPAIAPLLPLCEGDTLYLSASTINNAQYSWSGPNGFSSSLQHPVIPNATAAQAGTYSVFASVNGCNGPSSTVTVTVNAAPVVSINPLNPGLCAGSSVTLTASGATTYTWSDGSGVIGTNASVTIAPLVTSTYTVSGNSSGCSAQSSATVTVHPAPLVDAGPDLVLCNQPVAEQLSATPAGGIWSGAGITAGGQYTPSGTGVFTVTYTFTDANSCSASDDVQITVNNPVAVGISGDTAVCLNSAPFQLTAAPAGGVWSGMQVSSAGLFTPAVSGVFTLTYSAGNASCMTSDSMEITVHALPSVNAGNDFSLCADDAAIGLNGNPAGGVWSGTGISASDFDPAVSGTGNFVLQYVFTDANSCSSNDALNATVHPLPLVDAGPDLTLCNQPIPTSLSATPAGGTWTGPHVNAAGLFTPNGVGTFTLTYTYSDANSCENSDVLIVTVVDPVPADAGADAEICLNAPALTLTGLPAGGSWSGSNVGAGGVFTPANTGTFLLSYTYGTGTCLTSDQMEITVHALPLVDAGSDVQLCVDAADLLLNGNPAGGNWSGNGITNSSGIFSPATAGIGTHTLTYSYTDGNGCQANDQLTAVVNALPLVDAGPDTLVCDLPSPVTLSATPAGGIWSGTHVSPTGIFTPNGTGSFTVTYTYALANGCSASDDRVVNVIAPQQASAGTDIELCHNAPATQLAGTPAGGSWSGSFVNSSGLFTPSTPGVYTLTYTYGTGNCTTMDDMQVTVHALPVVGAGSDEIYCVDATPLVITGTPNGGNWSGNGVTDPVLGVFDPQLAAVGVHTLVYSYTDPLTGCSNSDDRVMDIKPLPVVSFINNPIACVGSAELFDHTGSGATTFYWDFGDGTSSSVEDPSHTYNTIGTYTIQLTTTSLFACVSTITGSVDVYEPPFANFTLAPDSACGPLVVSFTDFSSGQSISYHWDFGNGTTATVSNPGAATYTAGYLADTTYYITLSVSNFCATVTHTDSVKVMPEPHAVFGTNVNTGCSPFTPDFANNSVGLPDAYYWDFGDGTSDTTSQALFGHTFTTGTEDTTYTITLIVENECGADTAYHVITVLPNTVHAFFNASDTSGCVPLGVDFTQFSTGATFSSWDFGDGNVSALQHPSHTFTSAGTYTVQLFINDGCSYDTASVSITVHPDPVLDFTTVPDSVCAEQEFQFTNLSSSLANVHWDFGDGDTSLLTNPLHAYGASGVYSVTLSGVSTQYGCTASVTKPVIVRTTPLALFVPSPLFGCEPLPVNFSNTSTNADFYAWNFGDGNSSAQSNPTHTFASAGSYVVSLVATNLNGCSDTVYQNILVNPNPVSLFTTSSLSSCYSPVTVQMNNASSGAVGYYWDFGNGQSSVLNEPAVTYVAPGTYTISLIAETQFGCTDTSYFDYVVHPTPVASFSVPSDTSCELYAIPFTNTSQFGTSYLWSFGDGSFSTAETPVHEYSDSGLYSVTLIVTGAGNCSDTLSLPNLLTIFPSPAADFSWFNVQHVDPASGTVEFTNLSTGAISYQWDFGNGQQSAEMNPVHRFRQYGLFYTSLVAVNEYGCTDTVVKEINVDFFNGLFMPNAMYPGHPDFSVSHFIPAGVGLKTFHVSVYDDWGNLLWECSELSDTRPACAWDGTYNGVPVPQDAYVWKVEAVFLDESVWEGQLFPNGLYRMAGTVTVIR